MPAEDEGNGEQEVEDRMMSVEVAAMPGQVWRLSCVPLTSLSQASPGKRDQPEPWDSRFRIERT